MIKKCLIFSALLALSLTASKTVPKQDYAGDGDYVTGTPLPPRQEGVSFLSNNVAKGEFAAIYFPFDSSEIGSSETGKLQQIAGFLKGSQHSIILAGFTDERGTEEYNRALGESRAEAAETGVVR